MTRKRQNKWKRQKGPSHEVSLASTSLEEDLRLQRLRQKEKSAHDPQRTVEKDSEIDNGDETTLDDDLGLEPTVPSMSSCRLPLHLISNGGIVPWPNFAPEFSYLYGLAIQQQSPGLNTRKRTRLGRWMSSKYLFGNLQCNRRASLLYSDEYKWTDQVLPGDMYCSWDMACKHYLHSSARTLDVAYPNDADAGMLPTVATALQGGWGIFQPRTSYRDSRIHTSRCKPVYAIRLHEKSQRLGTVVRTGTSSTSYKFHFYSLPHATNYIEADLLTSVHDFCFGTDLAIFSCPRFGGQGRHASSTSMPLFLRLDQPSGILRSLNIQNLPQSDALRVEMSCEKEKYIAFGHRNGQVSLVDLRQSSSICSIIQGAAPTDLGSATDLIFLSNQKQLMVKRSFGPCELHDLRMLSPCPKSLVHTFQAPEFSQPKCSLHKLLSANCNGFMIDPNTQQTLVSPYVNSLHQPCLGIWNMVSGDLVGTKVLDDNVAKEVFYVELSSTTTAGFDSQGRLRSSWFGAWMKCGRFSDGKIHGKHGSLHHLTFPGRYSDVRSG